MSRTPHLVSIKRRGRRGNGATRAVKRDVSVIDWRLWMLRLLSASLIIALLMVTASVIHQVRSVEIGDVMITGYSADAGMSSSGASEDQLRALIAEQLNTGFWQLNLQQLKVQLESHPWVRQAMIRREWPNRLVIGIDEYVAVARWNERYLLSATGDIFAPKNIKAFMPLPLFVVEGYQADAGPYSQATVIRQSVEWFNRLQKPLANYGLSIRELVSMRGGDFSLLLSNGMQMKLGAVQLEQRFDRFLTLLDGPLSGRARHIETIDLRYSNGVSIQWRSIDSKWDDELELAVK